MKKAQHLELYRQMVLIRRLEERAAELYQQGFIGGFHHPPCPLELNPHSAVGAGLVTARIPFRRRSRQTYATRLLPPT